MKKRALLVACLTHNILHIASEPPKIYELGQNAGHYIERNHNTIDTLVMHYTEEDLETTLKIFFDAEKIVSSHYIVSENGTLFSNIHEENAARHAGAGNSYWNGVSNINQNSLGIEHVNLGFKHNAEQPAGIYIFDREWYLFSAKQIDASIALSKYLIAKYGIKSENIVGHSDIAPKRKIDPGPLFPWQKFAAHGVGAWPNFETSWELPCFISAVKNNDLQSWLIEHLHLWGYKLPDEQADAIDIIRAFQIHFRQHDITGTADLETAKILNTLLCNYKTTHGNCPCKK